MMIFGIQTSNKQIQNYAEIAYCINKSRTDFQRGSRVVAIFLRKSKPLIIVTNVNKNHTQIQYNGYGEYTHSLHAEHRGIMKLSKNKTKADSVIIIRGINNLPSLPCSTCLHLLEEYGIKKIFINK